MFCIHFLCGDIEKMNKEPMLGGKPKFSKSRLYELVSSFFVYGAQVDTDRSQ